MTLDDVRAADPSGMYDILARFPDQVEEAIGIGAAAKLPGRPRGITSIVLTGLGGSAIAGDLLRSYLSGMLKVPLLVNRHYTLPAFVGRATLVLVSSYSGNTEETNAAHRAALRRGARIVCISSGGATARLAARQRTPLVTIPGGLPPRGALGYSFFPLLIALTRMGFVPSRAREITETVALLRSQATAFADPASAENPATARDAMVQQYRETFANPFKAAESGYIDAVIYPEDTRPTLIRSLEMLKNKQDHNPPKKHGNIPL
jgi:glucose/mannose-6-phosphate isomerase